LLSVGPTAALAASSDRIDVGWTILQNGYWKGSGSFSNLNGTYTSVCVGLWVKDAVLGLQEKSVRCVNTPKGSGFAFSAPDVACYTFSWGTVFTTVTGRSGTRVVDEKWSNSINESC
jgi:hypothetical protein